MLDRECAVIGIDWYRNNEYPWDRLHRSQRKVAEAERRLAEAKEELQLSEREMAAYDEFRGLKWPRDAKPSSRNRSNSRNRTVPNLG